MVTTLLWGGQGNDKLYGGRGNDTFVLALGEGTDTIYDFATGDLFGLANGLSFGALTFAVMETATLISSGEEVLAEVNGFTNMLSSADFVVV